MGNNPSAFTSQAAQSRLEMQIPGDVGLCQKCGECPKQEKCPDCPQQQKCPVCPTVNNVATNMEQSSNIVTSSKSQIDPELPTPQSSVSKGSDKTSSIKGGMVSGASMGAIIALFSFILVIIGLRCGRISTPSSSDVEFSTVSGYRDNP